MSLRLGVLVVHGIGSQGPRFAEPMVRELVDRLDDKGLDPASVVWEPVHWAPVLEPAETDLWTRLSSPKRLHWSNLRRFVVSGLGDAIAYQQTPGRTNTTYQAVHGKIHESVVRLQERVGPEAPLMVIAHSLGGVMMSNHIWDRQRAGSSDPLGRTPFERFETLVGLVTFGCGLPLFTLAYDPVEAIDFPPRRLSASWRSRARWYNFYDPDDVLAYPLKPLSPSYDEAVSKDYEVNVGGLFASWNMMSHNGYWTDNDFTSRVARLIAELVG